MTKVCQMTCVKSTSDVRIFHKECLSLAKAGYDVTLVGKGRSAQSRGVRIVGVGEPGGRLKQMTSFARKVYKAALAVDAEIYHFHDPALLPYGLKLKKKGKIVFYDSHENTSENILYKYWIPKPLRRLVRFFYSRLEGKVCKKIDAVVIVTPKQGEYFQKFNSNVCLITNYPILQKMEAKPQFSAKRIGFAGAIAKMWNHANVLKALEQLPGYRYCLCGSVRGEPEEYLKGLQKLPGWKQVDFLGEIPHEKVREELSRCSVGLALASPTSETFWENGTLGNTKIFEEMMAGLPVVCTNFLVWKEFVNRWKCGICIDPQNPEEIAKALGYLAEHPDQARQMGQNGRRAVEEEFNWGLEEKKLLSLYENFLSKKSSTNKKAEN